MNTENKLIAEFMGVENTNGLVFQDANTKEFHSIKYHTSWDWLMPVVEKIEKLKIEGRKIYFSLSTHSICVMLKPTPNDHIPKTIVENKDGTKIEATYKAVVQFIKEYNNQLNK